MIRSSRRRGGRRGRRIDRLNAGCELVGIGSAGRERSHQQGATDAREYASSKEQPSDRS
jgi:hypothetical protein